MVPARKREFDGSKRRALLELIRQDIAVAKHELTEIQSELRDLERRYASVVEEIHEMERLEEFLARRSESEVPGDGTPVPQESKMPTVSLRPEAAPTQASGRGMPHGYVARRILDMAGKPLTVAEIVDKMKALARIFHRPLRTATHKRTLLHAEPAG